MKKLLSVLVSICFIAGLSSQNLIKKDASVVKLAGGLGFTEGPIADAKGDVYFADIPPRKILKWNDKEGLTVFKEDVPGCNGLFFDGDSNMVVCGNAESQSMWKLDMKTGAIDVLAAEWNGIKYNGPNDLWIDQKGGIYFTDPLYGKRDPAIPKLDSEGVYYILPGGENVIEVISDFVRPNGIIADPKGKTMYAADINDGKVYTYKINKNGTLSGKKLFANEPCDGMTIDEQGNLYFTNSAVKVYNSKGEKLMEIEVPERPSNVCFGGPDRKTLYITARTGFYAIKMNVKGVY